MISITVFLFKLFYINLFLKILDKILKISKQNKISKCQKYTSQVFVKEVTTIATRSASTILIAFVLTTLFLFAILRIFDVARVIQMNMEISIVCAHGCLILPSSTGAIEVNKIDIDMVILFSKNFL